MKTSLMFWLAIMTAVALRSAAADSPTAATPGDTAAATKAEVIATYDAAVRAAESLNVEALVAFLTDNDEGALIINGRVMLTRTDAVEMTRKNFRNLKAVKYTIGTRHVTLLGPDAALLVTNGTVSAQTEDGPIINRDFAHTVVYVRQNGIWRVLHSHQSTPR